MRRGARGRAAVLSLLLALAPAAAFNVNEVEAFTTHELRDLTDSVRLDGLGDATPVAFGDFDSDQYTDVFVVPASRDELRVLRWDHEGHAFVAGPTVSEGIGGIVNVVASDFNRDGRLDVIVMREPPARTAWSNSTHAPERPCTRLTFIPGHITAFGDPVELAPAFGQPTALNVDADPATDFFGEACADASTLRGRGPRSFWLNDGKGAFVRKEALMGSEPLAHVPSPAAVDVDGDCRADLVVPVLDGSGGGVTLEVWLAAGDGHAGHLAPEATVAPPTYPSASLSLPPGVQQLAWADLNGDGAYEAIGPVCDAELGCGGNATGAVEMVVVSTLRRKALSKDLCTPDPAFRLASSNMTVQGLPSWYVGWASPAAHGPLPVPPLVRLGDFDLDGLPDVLAGLRDASGAAHVVLLRNRHGEAFEVAFWRMTAGGSIVVTEQAPSNPHAWDGPNPDLATAHSGAAHSAAFFDVDETGNLDVLLLGGSRKAPSMHLLRNDFSSDDYFLKVLTLDGECLRWCAGADRDPDPPPYGVNQPGVSYMFQSTAATGSKRIYAGTQMGVSAHSPLATPFVLFGLGRTNDYVNDFWVGMPSQHKRRFDAGIIPNSQLIAIPTPWERPSRWTIELYISKASMLPWVALALATGLTCIGMVVIFLEWRERREDFLEKKAMAPSLPL